MDKIWDPQNAVFDEDNDQIDEAIVQTNEKVIQTENEDYLDSLLASMNAINESNAEINQAEQKKHKKEEEERKIKETQIHEEQKRKILREQYEQEQREKALREAEEAAEAAKLAEEEEKRKQNNMFHRIINGNKKEQKYDFSDIDKETENPKKPENKQEQEDTVENNEPIENITVEQEDVEKEEKVEKVEKSETITDNISNLTQVEENSTKSIKSTLFGIFNKKSRISNSAQVEEKNDKENDFEYLATHDELTGLKNERGYNIDIKKLQVKGTAILFFDVNNLKYTNDTLGHQAGNKLLLATSEKLKELFGNNGYRVGGDEFLVVLSGIKEKDIPKKIDEPIDKFRSYLKQKTKDDAEGIIYSTSVGYEVGTNEKSLDDVKKKADEKMYANKQAYKNAHPQYDLRNKTNTNKPTKTEENYDDKLTKEQRVLKAQIKNNHRQVNVMNTERILMEIQSRANDVHAILIASATFDHLFIMQDVNHFINLMMENQNIIDYSYIYVIYDGGPQYCGSDEYLSEVTHLFEAIEDKLKNVRSLTDKELLKIKGINIFKNIYLG